VRKRISIALATAAFLGTTFGAIGLASPSFASNQFNCSTRTEASLGASAICTKLGKNTQAVIVSCRRAANGATYSNTGKYVRNNVRSWAYCSAGDIRTGYRTNAGDIILT
jgi:hypothetical protein